MKRKPKPKSNAARKQEAKRKYETVKPKEGRPTDYREEYCEGIIRFFSKPLVRKLKKTIRTRTGAVIEEEVEVPNEPPTIESYSKSIGVVTTTIVAWTEKHPEFLAAYTRAKEIQKDFINQQALMGRYNSNYAIFFQTNNTDMRSKNQVTGPDDKPLIPVRSSQELELIDAIKNRLITTMPKAIEDKSGE